MLVLNVATAHAALITVETFWQNENNSNSFLNTTASLDSSDFTGVGSETLMVTEFDLVFGDLRPAIPDTFLTADLSSTKTIFIEFLNVAVFRYSSSFAIGLDPGNNYFSISLPLQRLVRVFPLVGQANFRLQPGSVVNLPAVSPVPAPATGLLFLAGLVGLAGLRLGRRNRP